LNSVSAPIIGRFDNKKPATPGCLHGVIVSSAGVVRVQTQHPSAVLLHLLLDSADSATLVFRELLCKSAKFRFLHVTIVKVIYC